MVGLVAERGGILEKNSVVALSASWGSVWGSRLRSCLILGQSLSKKSAAMLLDV